MRLSIIGLAIAAAILVHGPALSCDCSQPNTAEAFAEASHVVVVTVVGQDYELPPPPKTDGGLARDQIILPIAMRYRLAVERAWKGARVEDILVIRRAYAEMSNCDYWLTVGTKHLLYLSYVTRGGQTSLDADAPHCGRSRALVDAESEITAIDALVNVGSSSVSAAQKYGTDFAAHAAALEREGSPQSIAKAIVMRRGLGQPDKASSDVQRLFTEFKSSAALARTAAAAYFLEVIEKAPPSDPATFELELRQFRAQLGAYATSEVQVRTHVLLGQQLWQKSCPIAGAEGACVERFDIRTSWSQEQQAKVETAWRDQKLPVDICNLPPRYQYIVHPRVPRLAQEAQELFAQALRTAHGLHLTPGDPLDDAVAAATFFQLEPQFEGLLAKRLPKEVQRPELQKTLLRKWLTSRLAYTNVKSRFLYSTLGRGGPQQHTPMHILYQKVLEHRASPWAVAAQARIGQLLQDLYDQLILVKPKPELLPEPPYGIGLLEWKKLFDDRSCDVAKHDLSWQAEESFERCDKMALDQMLESPFVRLCQKVAWQNRFPEEIRIRAEAMTQALDLAPVQTHLDDEPR